MTDSGKRFDGFSRDPVEIGGRVAEALGHGAAHLEVELAARVRRDLAVHLFDLALELARVDLGVHARKLRERQWRSPERTPAICRDFAGRSRSRMRPCK